MAGRRDELQRIAARNFGWSRLTDEQLAAMEHVMAGHDVLAVLPTGAGKSAIYQVPALLLDGPTLVVSPLIALQHDQIEGIEGSRAPAAVALNSAQRAAEREHAWESLRAGEAEYLFLSLASFDRPNLRLGVDPLPDDDDRHQAVVTRMRVLTADPATRPGLVYVTSRKDAETYAGELAAEGVRVAAYHAGVKAADRERVHEEFLRGDLDVVVATSAFGMGIDKADLRFVLHAAAPESLDTYYQQIGRAGRDGEPAEITLYHRPRDLGRQKFLTTAKAPERALAEVATTLAGTDVPLKPAELGRRVAVSAAQRTRAVNLLEQTAEAASRGERAFPVNGVVEHAELGRGVVMSADDDTVTVVFDGHGYKTLSTPAVLEHGLLAAIDRWLRG